MWEIWCRQGKAIKQESLDEADFMETKFPSLPRKISCKARWSTPQGHKYDPLGAQGGVIDPFIRELPTRRRITGRKPTAAASPQVA
jgi:hypothetical protein